VAYTDLDLPASGDPSAAVRGRVIDARARQAERFSNLTGIETPRQNADLSGDLLENVTRPDDAGRQLLAQVADKFGLTARGYHRLLRVARTIADLEGSDHLLRDHVAEAISYRLITPVMA
jgi:magnesium chelatase family protein